MDAREAIGKMVAPGDRRAGKYREGVIQIHITRACDKSCFGCTQGSNLAGPTTIMSVEHFRLAVESLGFRDGMGAKPVIDNPDVYFGVVGLFGGNPAMSPLFGDYCEVLKSHVPFEQRGLWCNHPRGKGRLMAGVFNPAVSNLNVHMDQEAMDQFRRDWPESRPFGLHDDSRHSPPFVAMKDVIQDEGRIWELISNCDINQHWSAMIGVFRGELQAWFCEVAGAQAMLHQHDETYPETGLSLVWDGKVRDEFQYSIPGVMSLVPFKKKQWWQLPMSAFLGQVRKHCFDCGVPLRGYGELAQAADGTEQTSATHANVYKSKRPGREVEIVTNLVQLNTGKIAKSTHYLQNAKV